MFIKINMEITTKMFETCLNLLKICA